MMSSRSGLRSAVAKEKDACITANPVLSSVTYSKFANNNVRIFPRGTKLPGLTSLELKLLREKQNKLLETASKTLEAVSGRPHLQKALESTLIFAQYEAGTAVCIDPSGWILTCAHCFGDTEDEYKVTNKRRWLLSYTGLAIQVECQVWDAQRDLALLEIVAIESNEGQPGESPTFQCVPLCPGRMKPRMSIICIGQPGRDDLESTSDKKTKYNLIEVSEGTFRGMVKDADPQDNSEIGSLMHDAWTYWGHSGAPLLRELDGALIGLHSSWDDETAMRHGVPLVAITEFLKSGLPQHSKSISLENI